MQEGERTAWYKAALMTIGEMPEDLLAEACAAARRVCDHPAKIVPFICAHNPNPLKWRRDNLRHSKKLMENITAPRLEQKNPEYVTAEEMAALRAELVANIKA